MGRPEKPIVSSRESVAALARDLRALRSQAGNPTYRQMARRALFSASVLSSAASGNQLPTLAVTLAFVRACDGDVATWRRRWMTVSGTIPPVPGLDQPWSSAAGAASRDAAVEDGHGPPATRPPARPPAWPPVEQQAAAWGPQRVRPLPARSPSFSPSQLPCRPKEPSARVDDLRGLVATARTGGGSFLVTGPIGVGKSDLALRMAHALATTHADGQLYADMSLVDHGETDAYRVMHQWLVALGVEAPPADPARLVNAYRSVLSGRQLVLLLDNVDDERQARPFMAESRSSVVIAVSRRPLLGIGHVHRAPLSVLSRDAAVRLLQGLLGLPPGAHSAACDALARACCDLPLALDVAARRLLSRPHWSVGDLVTQVCDRGLLLSWLRAGDLSVRQRLEGVHAGLSTTARRALRDLYRADAGRRAPLGAAQLSGVNWVLADEALEELADAGMLRRGARAGEYRMDDLVRAFLAASVTGIALHA